MLSLGRGPRRLLSLGAGLRCAAALARIKAGARLPLKVAFHITYRCNLTCGYCGRREAVHPELEPAAVGALLEKYRSRGAVFWSWNGGEPLLRPDIEGHAEKAAGLGLRQLLISNLSLLPQRRSLLDHLQLIEASLDGPPEAHDRTRGRGAFASLERGLELARSRGVGVQILVVLTRTSQPHLPWLLDYARKAGAKLSVQPVALHREGPGRSVDAWALSPRELAEAARWLETQRPGGGVSASRGFLDLIAGAPRPECWAGRAFVNLKPDGSEALCCARLHEAHAALPDASSCRDCLNEGPQETNLALAPGALARSAFNYARGSLPWAA